HPRLQRLKPPRRRTPARARAPPRPTRNTPTPPRAAPRGNPVGHTALAGTRRNQAIRNEIPRDKNAPKRPETPSPAAARAAAVQDTTFLPRRHSATDSATDAPTDA